MNLFCSPFVDLLVFRIGWFDVGVVFRVETLAEFRVRSAIRRLPQRSRCLEAEGQCRETSPAVGLSHLFGHSFGVGPFVVVETYGHYVFSSKMGAVGTVAPFSSCVLSFQVSMYVSTFTQITGPLFVDQVRLQSP